MAARSRDGSFRAAREASGDDEQYSVTSPLPAGRGSEYLLMRQGRNNGRTKTLSKQQGFTRLLYRDAETKKRPLCY
jgi:hypothetical protein